MTILVEIISRYYEWAPFGAFVLISYIFGSLRKFYRSIFFTILALLWLQFAASTFQTLEFLGVDTLFESTSFDLSEAFFYLTSTFNVIMTNSLSLKAFIALTIAYSVMACLGIYLFLSLKKRFRFFAKHQNRLLIFMACFLLTIGVADKTTSIGASWRESLTLSDNIKENFSLPDVKFMPEDNEKIRNLLLVTYIGESTSSMHMGVYNYWRNTTPNLDFLKHTDPKIIIVNNVFSTHTMTSPSLLEALSLPYKKEDQTKISSIYGQRRVSLIDIMTAAGINTTLVSNQGINGTWNQSASVIFQNVDHLVLGSDELRIMGNNSVFSKKPFDHQLFTETLTQIMADPARADKPRAIFLHSHAGHGPYLNDLPVQFSTPVDSLVHGFPPEVLLGNGFSAVIKDQVEGYDSAIKYIDYSLSKVIARLAEYPEPAVFFYFSDHGESPYTGRGHDPSLFIHEMARVPFIITMNDEAIHQYPALFSALKEYASTNTTKSLRDLPYLVQFVFNLPGGNTFPEESEPIIIRDLKDGFSNTTSAVFIQGSTNMGQDRGMVINASDDATKHYVLAESSRLSHICYHRSNTVAKMLRGAFSAGCVEIDLFVDSNKQVGVTHPPDPSFGLTIDDAALVLGRIRPSVWFDSKNIDDPSNCFMVASKIAENRDYFDSILVEFPSSSDFSDPDSLMCISRLHESDVETSFYVPTEPLIACSEDVKFGNSRSEICTTLGEELATVCSYGIKGLSFDYGGIGAMKSFDLPGDIAWHAWHIDMSEENADLDRFGFLIPSNQDPNYR